MTAWSVYRDLPPTATTFRIRAGYNTGAPSMNIPLEFIRHPRARRYVIRVRPDGTVRVTMPRWGSKREAELFAHQQQGWIERQRRRVAEREPPPAPAHSPEELLTLKARARKELPAALLRLAAVHGLTVSRVSVRNQRWRWGSC